MKRASENVPMKGPHPRSPSPNIGRGGAKVFRSGERAAHRRRSRFLPLFALVFLLLLPREADSFGEYSVFHFAQIKYEGGVWNPNPTAGAELMGLVARFTSVRVAPTRKDITLSDPELFYYPFLYLTGCGALPQFRDGEIQRLRRYLVFGGMLLVDDCLADPNGPFAKSVRELSARLFPHLPMGPLPDDHTIFQTFFLLTRKEAYGRKMTSPKMEGVTLDGRTLIVFSPNDLGGALARDYGGAYVHQCAPGGEGQRQMAQRLALNIVMYALTVDYKKDQVHLPFILKRRR